MLLLRKTSAAVDQQRHETDQVAAAMHEFDATAHDVAKMQWKERRPLNEPKQPGHRLKKWYRRLSVPLINWRRISTAVQP